MAEVKNTGGTHHDNGKRRLDLIPISAFKSLGNVLTHGMKKYDERNWEGGIEWNRIYGSLLRHITAWWGGEDNDPESGLSHLDHALTNIAFLIEYTNTHPELDNRPKKT